MSIIYPACFLPSWQKTGMLPYVKGNFIQALDTAKLIDDKFSKVNVLKKIAIAQAQADEFAQALDTVQLINSEFDRVEVFEKIAIAQVQAGLSQQGLETAKQLAYGHSKFFPQLAIVFVEAKDYKSFKLFLIPCAYYLGSVYEMSVLLTKMYFSCAKVIAEVIAQS